MDGAAACSSVVTSPHRGLSIESKQSTPDVTLNFFRSWWRTDRMRGSMLASARSTKRSLVGSAFAPAPPTHSTGIDLLLQAATRCTYTPKESVDSADKSRAPSCNAIETRVEVNCTWHSPRRGVTIPLYQCYQSHLERSLEGCSHLRCSPRSLLYTSQPCAGAKELSGSAHFQQEHLHTKPP